MPQATSEEMGARFILGSGIRNVNFKQLEESSWPEMQGWFAKLLLSETCALFEGWIASALDELQLPAAVRRPRSPNSIDKLLQFPSVFDATGLATSGLQKALNSIHASGKSVPMQASFETPMIASRKNSRAHVENLLVCYRVFKEARNSFIHHGGRATTTSQTSYASYATETALSLGLKEKPLMPPIVAGAPIQLSLRGVVGFSDVVLRLVHTLDAELAVSTYAEAVLAAKWIKKHNGRVSLKVNPAQGLPQLGRYVHQCELPKPVALPALYTYMLAQGLVS